MSYDNTGYITRKRGGVFDCTSGSLSLNVIIIFLQISIYIGNTINGLFSICCITSRQFEYTLSQGNSISAATAGFCRIACGESHIAGNGVAASNRFIISSHPAIKCVTRCWCCRWQSIAASFLRVACTCEIIITDKRTITSIKCNGVSGGSWGFTARGLVRIGNRITFYAFRDTRHGDGKNSSYLS